MAGPRPAGVVRLVSIAMLLPLPASLRLARWEEAYCWKRSFQTFLPFAVFYDDIPPVKSRGPPRDTWLAPPTILGTASTTPA